MSDPVYIVPRQFAADILNVSLRTLDRYAKRNKISSVRRGRELFFSEQELLMMKAEQLTEEVRKRQDVELELRQKREQAEFKARVEQAWGKHEGDFVDVEEAQIRESISTVADSGIAFLEMDDMLVKDTLETRIYKNLYHEAREELGEVREKLQKAQFYVGELKGKIQEMVPMLSYRRQHEEMLRLAGTSQQHEKEVAKLETKIQLKRHLFEQHIQTQTKKVRHAEKELTAARDRMMAERVSRLLYATLLFLVSALVPLALIVRFLHSF